MRQIDLQEHQESKPKTLSVNERDLFHDVLPSVSIEPVKGEKEQISPQTRLDRRRA